jgi:cell division septal protein FtsQ
MSQSGNVVDLRKRQASVPRRAPPSTRPTLFGEPPSRKTPLRVRRRKLRLAIAFFLLLLLLFCVWGISYVSYLPRYSIQSISVVGASQVSPQLISSYAETILDDGSHHLISRKNIFFYPRAVIERDIVAEFPRIKSANLSRATLFSTVLTITVEERQSFALWCSDDSEVTCYSMDENGFIFAQAPQIPGTLPIAQTQYIFEGGITTPTDPIGQSFVPAHLPGLVALLQSLGQAGFSARGVSVVSDQDFSVPLTAGYFVKASFGEDPDTLTRNLQLILSSDSLRGNEQNIEYVDLRFGDHVYYKLKGQAEATSTASQ